MSHCITAQMFYFRFSGKRPVVPRKIKDFVGCNSGGARRDAIAGRNRIKDRTGRTGFFTAPLCGPFHLPLRLRRSKENGRRTLRRSQSANGFTPKAFSVAICAEMTRVAIPAFRRSWYSVRASANSLSKRIAIKSLIADVVSVLNYNFPSFRRKA